MPADATGRKIMPLREMLQSEDEDSLRRFIETELAAKAREGRSEQELLEMIGGIRKALAGAKMRGALKLGPYSAKLVLVSEQSEDLELHYEVESEPPHGILKLSVSSGGARPDLPGVEDAMSADQMVELLRSHLEKMEKEDRFSGAVLLAKGDEVLFQKAYGLASRRFDVQNKVDTKFNLGSMNKMFTATAIVQLAEQGKLSFDDKLSQHVPDYPNRRAAETITIHHLLTHTSGLGSYWEALFESQWTEIRTVEALIDLFAEDPLLFEPGERFEYSNSGFTVLGWVIERVSDQTYYDYVREHIFEPAGMENTDSYEMDQPVPNLAIGYTKGDPGDHRASGPLRNNLFMHTVKGGPAGGGYSTVGDLHRFALAIASNALLSPDSTEILLTGKVDMAPNRSYAYGFGDHREAGHRYHGHNGGAPGINADFRFYRASGYTYVVLANMDGAAMPVSRLIHEMIVRQ
jgi:CubicO group peptidase (beta-lactamase class C family)